MSKVVVVTNTEQHFRETYTNDPENGVVYEWNDYSDGLLFIRKTSTTVVKNWYGNQKQKEWCWIAAYNKGAWLKVYLEEDDNS